MVAARTPRSNPTPATWANKMSRSKRRAVVRPALETTANWSRECGQCRASFAVDEPLPRSGKRDPWLCPLCVVAPLARGSLQQRTVVIGGLSTQTTVFTGERA